MSTMLFKIVTPDGPIYEDQISQVTVPTKSGQITILPHHAALISALSSGEITIKKDDYTVALSVSNGALEVRADNKVYIIADTAERAENIDLERAEAGRKRAEELMAEKSALSDVEFARLQAKLEKEFARLRVGRKYKNIKV